MRFRAWCGLLVVGMVAWLLAAGPARAVEFSVQRDLVYSSSGQLMDLYQPLSSPLGPARPAIVMIHGGCWAWGSKEEYLDYAPLFAERGFTVMAINYRLVSGNKNQWPAQSEDVSEAVWYLRRNAEVLGVNPDKIAAMGMSAGGHLAGWLATTERLEPGTGLSSKVQAVISYAGPWSLVKPMPKGVSGVVLVGCAQGLLGTWAVPARKEASPLEYVSATSPPALFIHGTADVVVPVEQSRQANEALLAAGVPSWITLLPGVGHEYPADDSLWLVPVQRFLTWWLGVE